MTPSSLSWRFPIPLCIELLDFGGIRTKDAVPDTHEPLLRSDEAIGSQCVEISGSGTSVVDESGVAQDPEVFAHRWATHWQTVSQLTYRERAFMQKLENAPSDRFAECVEDRSCGLVTHR
jgi:hypothetical protein